MMTPRVSIVMPMLNARRFVRKAIHSVLNQSVDLEVVVVDDGCTDGSDRIIRTIKDDRIRLIRGGSHGVAAAFNAGLSVVRGELLARCDADDVFACDRLKWQMEWLDGHREFGAVCGAFSSMDRKGKFIREMQCGDQSADITDELLAGRTRTSFCTWLVRLEHIRQVKGCREFFLSAEDIDLQLRLAESCRVWYEPRPTYQYRLHDASATHTSSNARRYFYDGLARRLRLQRRDGGLDDLELGRPPSLPGDLETRKNGSRTHMQDLLLGAAWNEHAAGRRIKALRTALRACLASPINIRAWRSLGALALRSRA